MKTRTIDKPLPDKYIIDDKKYYDNRKFTFIKDLHRAKKINELSDTFYFFNFLDVILTSIGLKYGYNELNPIINKMYDFVGNDLQFFITYFIIKSVLFYILYHLILKLKIKHAYFILIIINIILMTYAGLWTIIILG